MSNYERFKKALEENEFYFEEVQEGDRKYFAMSQSVANEDEPPVMVFCEFVDPQIILEITITDIAKVEGDDKRDVLLEVLNGINGSYRFCKFTVDPQGDVFMSYSLLVNEEEEDFSRCLDVLQIMVNIATDEELRKRITDINKM